MGHGSIASLRESQPSAQAFHKQKDEAGHRRVNSTAVKQSTDASRNICIDTNLSTLKDESLFTSVLSSSRNTSRWVSPKESIIRKKVASVISKDGKQAKLPSQLSNRKSSRQQATDYIELNRKISPLSRTIGKEAATAQSLIRNNQPPPSFDGRSFLLTGIKEDPVGG